MALFSIQAPSAPEGSRLLRLAAWGAGAALLVLFAFRLTIGTCLGDEAYYANLVIGRLRHPGGDTGDHSAHLTFSLLLEPFVRAYRWFVPDFTGVMLYLRVLYGAMALATAAVAWSLLRRVLPAVAAAAIACVPVVFIPFSLPAPSYNSVAMMGTISALCLFSGHLLRVWKGEATGSLAVPGAAGLFALSVIAYPPSLVLAAACFLLVLLLAPTWEGTRPLVPLGVWGAAFLLLGAAVVVGLVGLPKIRAILSYDREGGQHMDWRYLLARGWSQFTSQRSYPLLCVLGILAGLLGRLSRLRAVQGMQGVALLGLAVAVLKMPAACFFAPGHDLVFFLAVAGLPVLLDLRLGKALPPEHRVLVLLYVAGLAGGGVSAWTASNALFNFSVGGTLAAIASLACLVRGNPMQEESRGGVLLPLGMAGALAFSSAVFVYGEPHGLRAALTRVVPSGAFAGLRTCPEQAEGIARLQQQLAPCAATCRSVLVASPYAGVYLLTSLKPRTPHSFFWGESPVAWKKLRAMADEPGGLPDLVVDYAPWMQTGPGQESFLAEFYRPLEIDGPAQLYLRNDVEAPAVTGPSLPYVVRFDKTPRGTGWSVPELAADGTSLLWMAAKEATMRLPRPASAGAVRLRIDVPCALALDVLDSLKLEVNGQTVPLVAVAAPSRMYEAILPVSLLGASEPSMRLKFSVNRTIVPAGGDRTLAVMFRGLEFTAASGLTTARAD